MEWCERILWSWKCEQPWNMSRSQSTLENFDPSRTDQPRFLLAARYTGLDEYLRKRFWKSTCSKWTIVSFLRETKEFGIIFLQAEKAKQAKLWNRETGVRSEPQDSAKYQLFVLIKCLNMETFSIVLDEFVHKIEWWKTPRYSISELQGRNVRKNSLFFTHNVVDQRSRVGILNRRSYGVSFICFWNARCEDGVCIEDDPHWSALPKIFSVLKNRQLKKRDRFVHEETHCVHDLWLFSSNRSSWCSSRRIRSGQYVLYMKMTFRIFGTRRDKLFFSASEIPQIKFGKVCLSWTYEDLPSSRPYWLCTTNKSIEIEQCQAIKDSPLWWEDTPIRWSVHELSKSEIERIETPQVGSNWTMFKRRVIVETKHSRPILLQKRGHTLERSWSQKRERESLAGKAGKLTKTPQKKMYGTVRWSIASSPNVWITNRFQAANSATIVCSATRKQLHDRRRKVVGMDQLPCWRCVISRFARPKITLRKSVYSSESWKRIESNGQTLQGNMAPVKISGERGGFIARNYAEVRTSRTQSVCAKIAGQEGSRNFAKERCTTRPLSPHLPKHE